MKFLCIGYFNQEKMDACSKEVMESILSECQPHLQEFYKSGQVMMDVGVDKEVRCIERVNGTVMAMDCAFVENNEMIGSVFVIEANDIEEATRIASLHPTTQVDAGEKLGWRIEIRPIHYFERKE